MNYDIVCFGNIVKDTFLYVKKPCFHTGIKQEIEKIFFSYGGGALNSAVNFKKLGLKVSLVGSVGQDGKDILDFLHSKKIPSSFLLKHGKTSYSAILT